MKRWLLIVPLALFFPLGCADEDLSGPALPPDFTPEFNTITPGTLSGAIFTTNSDGSLVNEKARFESKREVYLDGGPPRNAKTSAAALREGDYYFQVTDPKGEVLLSTDDISCREIHVNEYGLIDQVYPAPSGCEHHTGTDMDWYELGAITVQLFPFDNTPNPAGVYKVWVTPTEAYVANQGFHPAASVTTVFKAGSEASFFLSGMKFNDLARDGKDDWSEKQDPGLEGWRILVNGTGFWGEEIHMEHITDSNGYWELSMVYSLDKTSTLIPAVLEVCEEVQAPWYQSFPNPDVAPCYMLTVPPDGQVAIAELDFGNWQDLAGLPDQGG